VTRNTHPPGASASSLWRNSNFLLLWSGQGVSALGSSITELSLPILVLAVTGSPAQAGFVAAVGTAPNLLFSLLAGALVDRWNRKLVMIVCDLTRFLALGSVPLAYALGQLSLAQLFIVAGLQGTCFVFFGLAMFSCLPNIIPKQHIARANSLNQAAESGGLLLGPGLAGTIINLAHNTKAGAALVLMADSISYLVSAVSLMFIRGPFQSQRGQETQSPLHTQIGEGVSFLWSRTGLRVMLFVTMSILMFTGPLYIGVIMLAGGMGADALTTGLIFSGASLGGVTGAVLAPWLQQRLGNGKLVILAVLVPALLLPVMAMATNPWVLVLGWAIIDVTVPFFNIAQVSYRFSVVPDAIQGRVGSVFRTLGFGAAIVGTSLGGILLDQFGPRPVFLIMAGGLALTAGLASLTEIRRAGHAARPVLRGSVRSIPPTAVLRMLAQLGRTGLLRLSYRRLSGEVYVRNGRVVAAQLSQEHGLAALEGIAVALPDGEFRFEDDVASRADDAELLALDLPHHLELLESERSYVRRMIPSLRLVPQLVGYGQLSNAGGSVVLRRGVVRLLPALALGRTVEAMALEYGLIDSIRAVVDLLELELATLRSAKEAGRQRPSAPPADVLPAAQLAADPAPAELVGRWPTSGTGAEHTMRRADPFGVELAAGD
jgi:MFS family permease